MRIARVTFFYLFLASFIWLLASPSLLTVNATIWTGLILLFLAGVETKGRGLQ